MDKPNSLRAKEQSVKYSNRNDAAHVTDLSDENNESQSTLRGPPPNETVRKLPDEVYSDTQIPKSHREVAPPHHAMGT